MTDPATVLVTDEGEARTITLNRPERRNAMTPEMQNDLIAAMYDAAASDCRVVIFAGTGQAFCSGLDLTALQQWNEVGAAEHKASAERVARLFRALYELPKPTIAVVHGPAIAGGTGLATICDFTLAAPDARFGYTEVRIGFVPAVVSAFLSLQVGEKQARDLLLTGRIFDADEAHRLGLVNELIPADRMQERLRSLVALLVANSPAAIAATKRLLAAQSRGFLDRAIEHAMEANAVARETRDFREGVTAFLQKRKPVWTGS